MTVAGLALTLVYFVVGFITLICLIIFWPLGIIVGVCWLAATAWLLMRSLRSHDGKRSNRFVHDRKTKNVTLEELKSRAPRVANDAASMIQTSKWLFDNGKTGRRRNSQPTQRELSLILGTNLTKLRRSSLGAYGRYEARTMPWPRSKK